MNSKSLELMSMPQKVKNLLKRLDVTFPKKSLHQPSGISIIPKRGHLIPKYYFNIFLEKVLSDLKLTCNFESSALKTLQEVIEEYLVGLISDTSILSKFSKRKTLMRKDVRMVRVIRGEKHLLK